MLTFMNQPRFIALTLSALASALSFCPTAHAANATWNGTTDTLWATSGNWSTAPVPGVGDIATFNNAGNGNTTLTVGTISLSQVLFNTSSAAAYTLGSGTIAFADGTTTAVLMNSTVTANQTISAQLTLGTAIASTTTVQNDSTTGLLTLSGNIAGGSGGVAAAKTLTVTGSGNTTISGAISNGGTTTGVGLNKTGTGTLVLTNTANSFTRAVSVSGGTLRASDSTVYGAGDQNITSTVLGQASSNGVTFGSNATAKTLDLRYNGQNDGTAQKLQLLNSKGGNLLVNATSTNTTINVDRESGTGTNKTIAFFNASIANGSVLTVTGANGYSLGLGTLSAGTGGAAGNLTIAPTTANVTIGNINNAGTTGFAHTLILDGTSSGNTITGAIANSATGGGVISVTKQNTSTWTFSGINTYTGATAINGGKLAVASTGRINSTSGIAIGAGELSYNSATALTQGVSFNSTGGTLRGTGTLTPSFSVTSGNTVAAGPDAATLGTLTFGGSLTGNTGATFSLKLNSASALSDLISAAGISLGGATLALSDLGSATITSGTFTILSSSTTSITGTFAGLTEGATITVGSNNFIISYLANSGRDITLTASASSVPEPSSWALIAGSAALLGVLTRRHRRAV